MITPKKEKILLLLIVLFSGFLLFYKPGDAALWQDEANTALVGQSVIKTGLPHASDGKNTFIQNEHDSGGSLLWRWHPWLQFYVSALSQKIFGKTTFGARALFAFIGVLTVVSVFLLARAVSGSGFTGILAALLIATSLLFITLTRQCRYYPVLMLVYSCGLYGYFLARDRIKTGVIIYTFSLLILFHTLTMFIAPLIIAILIHSYFFEKKLFRPFFIATLAVCILNAPVYFAFYTTDYNLGYGFREIISRLPEKALFYSGAVLKHLFTPVSLACLIFILVSYRGRNRFILSTKKGRGILLMAFIIILLLGIIVPFPYIYYIRYLSPVIPYFMVINALLISAVFKKNKYAGIAAAVMFVVFSGIHKHIKEISSEYRGPLEAVSGYLNKNAAKDDIVYVAGYGDLPLKFYTGLKVTGGEAFISPKTLHKADWVIIRRLHSYLESYKYADDNMNFSSFRKIILDVPDTKFENREDPGIRYRKPQPETEKITVYKRLRQD